MGHHFEEIASMRTLCCIALLACVGLLGSTSLVQANPLPPGANVVPDTAGGATGTIIADTGRVPFSFDVGGGTVAGTYQEQVSVGRPGNTLGGVSFLSNFLVTTTPQQGHVQSFSMSGVGMTGLQGFGGWMVDAAFFQPGGTASPFMVSRTGDGVSINWAFNGVAATSTGMMVLDTNAPTFSADGIAGFAGSGGGVGNRTPAFQPAAPEPGTLALALVGLPLATAFGYRRLRRGKPA
jgi:hypothetical protein